MFGRIDTLRSRAIAEIIHALVVIRVAIDLVEVIRVDVLVLLVSGFSDRVADISLFLVLLLRSFLCVRGVESLVLKFIGAIAIVFKTGSIDEFILIECKELICLSAKKIIMDGVFTWKPTIIRTICCSTNHKVILILEGPESLNWDKLFLFKCS